MNINDESVLEMLNKLIVINRLNKKNIYKIIENKTFTYMKIS